MLKSTPARPTGRAFLVAALWRCLGSVCGAVVPFVQGYLTDQVGLQISFLVPACCYVYIAYFGLKYAGIYSEPVHP